MANKISINDNIDDYYEPSDSDNDYTEREKKLLKKVHNRKQKHADDSEEEVLPFDNDDDEVEQDDDDEDDEFGDKFEADSDLDQYDNDAIPDSRAWGKKRRDFFATDFVDQDYSSYTVAEEQAAEQEEIEAREIQKRLAQQLNEADFTLNVYATNALDLEPEIVEKPSTQKTKLIKDLTGLSHREKVRLFKKDSPEFDGLTMDFEQRLIESRDMLQPILNYFNGKPSDIARPPLVQFVQLKNDLILNYCNNIAFYLVLKSDRVAIKNHPIVKRLVQMRELLLQMEEKYQNCVLPELIKFQEKLKLGIEPIVNGEQPSVAVVGVKKSGKKLGILSQKIEKPPQTIEKDESDNENIDDNKETMESDLDNDDAEELDNGEKEMNEDDERRQITYQIAKNKGLTPHRKKELRNPRVKHRNKFRKALIRRKGAVRTVRKELKRYGGEISGIKATTKKGIKIK